MSRTSKTLLRLGVPSLAAATMVAGIPALLGVAPAQAQTANTATNVSVTAPDSQAAAGTCVLVVATATDANGRAVPGTRIGVVTTTPEDFASTFCTDVPGTTAGTTVTNEGVDADGDSVDVNSFVADDFGRVRFGVRLTSNVAEGATVPVDVSAFLDRDADNVADADEPSSAVGLTFTEGGGTAGSTQANNAVDDVNVLAPSADLADGIAEDDQDADVAFEGETRTYSVQALGNGEPIPGARISYQIDRATDGDIDVLPTNCGTLTNNDGIAQCAVPFPTNGNDTVTFFVNQTGGTRTSGPDLLINGATTNEPTDTLVVDVRDDATQVGRDVELTAVAEVRNLDQIAAGNGPTVTAVVDNISAGAVDDTTGTLLSFAVTGGSGDEFVLVGGAATNNRNECTTLDAAGNTSTCTVEIVDPTPQVSRLTVTGTVRGTNNSDSVAVFEEVNEQFARTITLTPDTTNSSPGTAVVFTATVTDADGRPVEGVFVDFTETGPGAFRLNPDGVTNRAGQITAEVVTLISEAGTQTITADITDQGTQCNALAGAGQNGLNQDVAVNEPAGVCVDTSTNVIGGAPATAPPATTSPSATPTATTQPTATPTATTQPTATPTNTTSPRPTATPTGTPTAPVFTECVNPAGISLSRGFITPGIPVTVTVTAPTGAQVEIQAYSRPSTTYQRVRQGIVGETGRISFDVVPGTNTRLFAACVGQTRSASASQVINVRTALSLTVVRNGSRNYTFQGRILPRRAGQLITLYRVTNQGSRILTAQIKTDNSGTYRINRRFTGSGTFGFLTRTGQTLTNAAGESNTPQTVEGINNGRGTARQTAIF